MANILIGRGGTRKSFQMNGKNVIKLLSAGKILTLQYYPRTLCEWEPYGHATYNWSMTLPFQSRVRELWSRDLHLAITVGRHQERDRNTKHKTFSLTPGINLEKNYFYVSQHYPSDRLGGDEGEIKAHILCSITITWPQQDFFHVAIRVREKPYTGSLPLGERLNPPRRGLVPAIVAV